MSNEIINNLSLVVAIDSHKGIGLNGTIPWHSKADMKHFKELTSDKAFFKNAVIMGRITYESIGKVLPNRLNVVITSLADTIENKSPGLKYVSSPELAIEYCQNNSIDNIYVIGGSQIYKYFMPFAACIYVTQIHTNDHGMCDKYIDNIPEYFKVFSTEPLVNDNNGSLEGIVVTYKRIDTSIVYNGPNSIPDEYQYLDIVRKILEEGSIKSNRTDTGAVSIFGHNTKWCLKDNKFPLLTTKKVFFRGIVEELLWFISGSTDSKVLETKGVKIWMPNTTREFLDNRGLTDLKEGDIGAGYGFQWRHSGADYKGHNADYTDKGVDQLKDLINGLKTDPGSRRHIICSWNPSALSKMALPPCHVLFQAYVEINDIGPVLHTILYQRSADVGLGVPFNIASYALLTRILAHCCDMEPGTFTHYTGDTHIYESHISAMKTQMFRIPRESPKLFIKTDNKDIFTLRYEDFEVVGYEPYDIIKMNMIA